MKSKIKFIFPLIIISGMLFGFKIANDPDPEKDKILIGIVRYALKQGHYSPHDIDDSFSEKVFTDFIDALDPYKRFFLQSDIDEFSKNRYLIDDQIKSEDLSFYNQVMTRFDQRVLESQQYYREILQSPFDFSKEASFDVDYDKKSFSKNKAELIKNWQLQLKVSTLSRLHEKIHMQESMTKNETKGVEEKEEEDGAEAEEDEEEGSVPKVEIEIKSFEELEKESREATLKSLDDLYTVMFELDDTDWFAIFINTMTIQFDPHTNYFAPKDKKRFDQTMSGKLEGIGARLQKRDDYTRVAELISGGPAWRGGELEVGDLILKVGQGDEFPVDIVGMRLDDAIEYIKGKKGTEVKLTVKKIDGSIKVISIIRDIVELEETFVKSSVVDVDNRKFGVINLPKFYIDFNERNFRNSATDMEQEIKRLKEENVEGLLIDLRNNGGGSLKTAIEIAGLFISNGPVVQVKYRGEKANIRSDKDKRIQWDGPLVVLVNELSASASEIFAAAMQDYNRAVIIGSKQSFGKGTVQQVLPLNNVFKYDKDLGAMKMTIQKFYRINGGSTQLKGVSSDIVMPDKYSYFEIGERDEKNPLSWDKIEPAEYTPVNAYENFHQVVNDSKRRIADNPHFIIIDDNAKWLKEGRDNTLVNLNYEKFKEEIDQREEESKAFDDIALYESRLEFISPKYELPILENDSILAKKRELWHKNLKKDIYVEEALTVLSELEMNKNLLVKN
ncbi:carboxy terminal-processing peptidase [Lutimonas zeaxanthinifaciens]|uniref:carboxy terminal-processing peptidase n=1 Tax=Lutimonas zeaxanthinifaciens TaxID=3060215 RepID=UPI00265CEB83|nr:carboxy terminal-processing peptidase [Lutimonas sp. YSD2104]WKK65980.1 carboxy terminal-processing peptidase [Lutimonas sp. YSD2104]